MSRTRDTSLADRLLQQVRGCSQAACALLVCTDGWVAYPNSIRRAFRDKVKRTVGPGRASLQVWSGLHIGTVIKETVNKHLTAVIRQMSHGSVEQAMHLLQRSGGGQMLNTSYIERFNGTVRERLATLTRKCRHAAHRLQALETGMDLIGSTYNFCCFHHERAQTSSGRSSEATETVTSDGQWFDRPSLESLGTVTRQGRSGTLGRAEATRPSPQAPCGRVLPAQTFTRPLPDPHVPKRPPGRPRKIPLNTFTV